MATSDKAKLIKRITELQERFFHSMRHEQKDVWLELNLTIAQMKSLIFINSEETTNFKMLAAFLRVTPPDVTRIVDRLVEQGLVSREENPDNRRMQMLKVTAKGATLLKGLQEHGPKQLPRILKQLNNEDLLALHQGFAALVRAAENRERQPQN